MKNIVLIGFGNLAQVCLKRLIDDGFIVRILYTYEITKQQELIDYCNDNSIKVSTKNPNSTLSTLDFDLSEFILVSVNYRRIIEEAVIQLFPYAINLHGSLLPKYRGRTPHVWALINGEEELGVTAHLMVKDVDKGPILAQRAFENKVEYNISDVLDIFISMYPDLLIQGINNALNNKIMIQNESDATYFGKRTPDMSYIDLNKSTRDVLNFIRALSDPYPNAYFYLEDSNRINIKSAVIENSGLELHRPINLIGEDYFLKCKDGLLKVLDYEIVTGD